MKKTEPLDIIVPADKLPQSPSYGSIISLKDGRLMWAFFNQALFSSDGGLSWSDPVPMKAENGDKLAGSLCSSLVRLSSGDLGLSLVSEYIKCRDMPTRDPQTSSFHISKDEGQTWSSGVTVGPPRTTVHTINDRTRVLSSGRIIIPVYSSVGPKMNVVDPKDIRRFGADFRNAHSYTMWFSFVYYSDDQGQTWQRSRNEAMVYLDNGTRGYIYDGMEEPAIVELKDGRLLMLARTRLGQHFASYSDDHGHTWNEPEPTGLTAVPAPCALDRIPQTGDLLVIWNQLSPWETMTGLYRHRLSCAVSKDEGKTWQNHKNLESLDDVNYIEVPPIEPVVLGGICQPVDRTRYHRAPGPLRCSYPTLTFHDGKAVITYGFSTFGSKANKDIITKTYGMDYDQVLEKWGMGSIDRANKVRVLPVEWFYE